ncbi:hypothetical protein RHAL1_00389 [Beijerinckiaceae bacterium RH AL1]|nr:hypothetical protein [Beijerinckiaceae bacterium]VVB42796.1 hypothetical protein RHAL8_00368 [Beijerinckiaceae bacterium RH AL8]VVB42807.1 hypothetical protein RHCH11_RHCH11_00370 [Beijerinckiaceae bacterium RH CH11]VVC53508.1 hypothetical protein RHAL1_00389 [Beijerinckiaceae bacterium RH AL1]
MIWILLGALGGIALGVVVGFAVALFVMQFYPRYDGTFGMREMLVCLPLGALAGLIAGLVWAFRG